jgi:hypothetical protein
MTPKYRPEMASGFRLGKFTSIAYPGEPTMTVDGGELQYTAQVPPPDHLSQVITV